MRSVVRTGLARCEQCRLPARWCICHSHQAIRCPLQVDVLMHHREHRRPSSSGHLIGRVMPDARIHAWHSGRPTSGEDIRSPDRDMWVLHPLGEPAPPGASPQSVQVVLLDGSWSEASAMAKKVGSWGRRVRLPIRGETRYWLRNQQAGGMFSTVEALIFVLREFGLSAVADDLGIQLEWHVYANLRMRGQKDRAMEFLNSSPVRARLKEAFSDKGGIPSNGAERDTSPRASAEAAAGTTELA